VEILSDIAIPIWRCSLVFYPIMFGAKGFGSKSGGKTIFSGSKSLILTSALEILRPISYLTVTVILQSQIVIIFIDH
jgi:hypothetical protein